MSRAINRHRVAGLALPVRKESHEGFALYPRGEGARAQGVSVRATRKLTLLARTLAEYGSREAARRY